MALVLDTPSGRLEGEAQRVPEGEVRVFRGIPFAEPPVGELRLRAPEPQPPWPGVRSAREFGASAPQLPAMLPLGVMLIALDIPPLRRRLKRWVDRMPDSEAKR